MTIGISLTGGQYVLASDASAGVQLNLLDGSLTQVASNVPVVTGGAVQWLGGKALANGGFTLEWALQGSNVVMAEDLNASGQATDSAYVYTGLLDAAALAPPSPSGTSFADHATAMLPNGNSVVATQWLNQNQGESSVTVQQFAPNGLAVGPTSTIATGGPFGEVQYPVIAPLAAGGYVAAAVYYFRGGQTLYLSQYNADGAQANAATLEYDWYPTTNPSFGAGTVSIAGLADGGFAVAWSTQSGQIWSGEFSAADVAVGPAQQIGAGDGSAQTPNIEALPDGRYVVSWAGANGPKQEVFTEAAPSLGLVSTPPQGLGTSGPPTAGESVAASGPPVTLTGASGWTSAAVLTNGQVAVVGGPGGSGVGTVTTYDASGTTTGSATLQEFEGAAPALTALTGGFYEVSYANTSDFEVYSSSHQFVFWHNAWSPAGQAFTPLQDGDDLITTQGSNSVALVAPGGAIDWVSIPSDAPSGVTPEVTALDGGGFALTYAGTSHFDLFSAAGQPTGGGDLGASMSSFATATTATNGGGFAEMWLSADGGQNGLPSSLDVQSFDASGKATSGVVTLTQDLDPWHTETKLVANADGSVAAFWSQGGQVWSSEITNGAAGAAQATGVTGSLSDANMIALSSGETGFAFLAYGDAWAEIWNPTTGTKMVAELGAATGDGSTLHALATADAGFAVSWHDGAAIEAGVMGANGQASAPMMVSGDLLAVNASGQAVTVYDNGQDAPVMQAYTLSGGSFWRG